MARTRLKTHKNDREGGRKLAFLCSRRMEIVLQLILNALVTAAFIALVAAGVSFLYATTRLFHLAHGVVAIAAGYAFWFGWVDRGWPAVIAAAFSVAVAAILGLAMNEFVYEPLRRRGTKGIGYLIATLALLTLGVGGIQLIFGSAPKSFGFQTATLSFGDVRITVLQLAVLAIAAICLVLFWLVTQRTRFGKAMRATADNETMAEVLGVDTRQIRRLSFLLASVLAAPAGILLGLEFPLDPAMGIFLAVNAFAATVIGGSGSIGGAVLGSLIIGGGEQVVAWFGGSGWRKASTFVLLFAFLLWRPEGMLKKK